MAERRGQSGRTAAKIAELAGAQRGLASSEQLDSLGFGRSGRQRARESGRLLVVRRGVVCLPGAPRTWETDVLAVILAAGRSADAVASHLCAARLLGLVDPRSRWWSDAIEVTAERKVRIPAVASHLSKLSPVDRDMARQVPVTSAQRTVRDLVGVVPERALGVMLDEALRRRRVTMNQLRVYLTRNRGARGSSGRAFAVLGRLVAERDGHPIAANQWESAMLELWMSRGLPAAVAQHWVWTPHGSYRPDLAIVDRKIAVDWNGYDYHGRRSNFDWDSDRRGHMVEAGWLPLDFTTRSTPEHVVRTVLAACAQRPPRR